MEEKIYTWEALKKINPWKYFFDEYSDKKLRHLICEWKTDFVHPDDKSSWKDEASLGTQQFTKKIILRLLYGRKDTLFLVMRSKAQWIKLIGEEMNTFKDRFLYNPNPRNQTLSPNNLKEGYNKILEAFRG